MPRKTLLLPILLILLGLTLAVLTGSADLTGIDPSTGWGRGRIAVLVSGVLLALTGSIPWTVPGLWRWVEPPVERVLDSRLVVAAARVVRAYWPAMPISVFVVLIYVWFATAGTWTTWVSPTRFYADLARGFQRGNLYLPGRESLALLDSPDPYERLPDGNVQGPVDVAYYNGRYYLAWGPTPALVVLLFRWLLHWWLGDLRLVLGFASGLYLLQAAMAIVIWDRFFARLPKWRLWLSVIVLGLAGPPTFMLDTARSGRVYEAAILSGQFCLMAGMLSVVLTLGRRSFGAGLVVAGILWALAIASRITLIMPVALFVAILFAYQMNSRRAVLPALRGMLPLAVILGLGLGIHAWYNWARFDNPLETGQRYQLTLSRVHYHVEDLISPAYLLPNLFNFVAFPPRLDAAFPFLIAEYGYTFDDRLGPDHYYFAQRIVGLLVLAPMVVFAVPAAAAAVRRLFKRRLEQLDWIALMLGGAALVSLAFLLFYHWAAMRYMMDFFPALLLLGVIGFWQWSQLRIATRPGLVAGVGGGLAVLSITVSLLVGISVNGGRAQLLSALETLAR